MTAALHRGNVTETFPGAGSDYVINLYVAFFYSVKLRVNERAFITSGFHGDNDNRAVIGNNDS